MEDYDRTLELTTIATESQGKADEQFAKYSDTVEYKLNQLKNTWEQFRISLLESDTYKSIIEWLTKVVEKLNDMTKVDLAGLATTFLILGKTVVPMFIKGFSGFTINLSEAIAKAINTAGQKAKTQINSFFTQEISQDPIVKQLDIDKTKAEKKITETETHIKELETELNSLAKKPTVIEIQAKTTKAKAEIKSLEQKINTLRFQNQDIEDRRQYLESTYQTQKAAYKSQRQAIQAEGFTKAEAEEYLALSGITKPKRDYEQLNYLQSEQEKNKAKIGLSQNLISNRQNAILLNEQEIQHRESLRRQLENEQKFYNDSEKQRAQAAQKRAEREEALAKEQENQAKQRGNMISQAFTTAITVGITTALTANDPGQAFLTTFSAGFLSIIPQVIQMVVTGGEGITVGFIASTAGIGLAIVAITAAVTGAVVLIKQYSKTLNTTKFDSRAKQAENAAKSAKEEAESLKTSAKQSKETYENAKKLKERYEELQQKAQKTTEEQEEYNDLVNQIRENFPDVVSYYNETTGELRTQNDLWDQIIQKQKQIANTEQRQVIAANVETIRETTLSNRYDTTTGFAQKVGLSNSFAETLLFGEWSLKSDDALHALVYSDAIQDLESFALAMGMTTKEIEEAGSSLSSEIDNRIWNGLEGTDLLDYLKDAKDQIKDINDTMVDGLAQQAVELKLLEEPDLSEAEKKIYEISAKESFSALSETLGKTAEEINQEAILGGGGKEFFNVFGGSRTGASDSNDFSTWAKLSGKRDRKITGLESQEITTVGQALDHLAVAFGATMEDGRLATDENSLEALRAAKDFYEENRKSSDGQIAILSKILDGVSILAIEDQDGQDNILEKLLPSQREQISNLYTQALSDGTTQAELEDLRSYVINSFDSIKDVRPAEAIEKGNEFVENLESSLKSAIKAATEAGLQSAEGWSDKQLNAIANWENEQAKTIGDTSAKTLTTQLTNIAKEMGLDATSTLALLQKDWSSYSLANVDDFEEEMKSTIKALQGEAYDEEKVDNFIESIKESLEKAGVLNLGIKTATDVENINERVINNLDKIVSLSSDLSDIVASQLKDGEINYSQYSTLVEKLSEFGIDANQFIQATSDGISMNAEALRDYLLSAISDEDKLTEIAKQQAQQRLDELKAQRNSLILKEDDVKLSKEIVRQKAKELALMTGKKTSEYYTEDGFTSSYLKDAESQAQALELQISELEDSIQNSNFSVQTGVIAAAMKETIDNAWNRPEQERAEEEQKRLEEEQKAIEEAEKAEQERLEKIQDALDEVNDIEEDIIDAQKDIEEAEQGILDAENDIVEKTKELNEALYGTDLWKSSLDDLYNYTILLDRLAKKIDKAKEAIDDLGRDSNARELLDNYAGLIHQESVIRQAENSVIEQSIANYMGILESQYSNYFYTLGDRLAVNWSTLVNAPMNNSLKDWVASTIEQVNKLKDQQNDNLDSIEKREKEFQEQRKTALDNYVKLEDDVVKILEEKYKQEVEDTKEKYDALKEADDDYLSALEDAISKQRELRERQEQWGDLAQKEKKLSLISRDTSGATQKEQLSLQKEIEEDRQSLLDNAVDDILNSLKEMYELQQETRDAEIEYQEAVLDNANLVKEANDIIMNQWQSPEDAIAWFYENNMEVAEMSAARLEQYTMEIESAYAQKDAYIETSRFNFDNALTTEQWEVENAINIISQTLTNEAWRSSEETQRAVAEEQEKAQEALNQAYEGLDNAYEKLDENIAKMNELQDNLAVARQNYIDAMNDVTDTAMDDINQVIAKLIDASGYWVQSHEEIMREMREEQEEKNNILDNFQRRLSQFDEDAQASNWKELDPVSYAQARAAIINAGTSTVNRLKYDDGYFHYASGGLVDYTGPAWVDGTPSNPEAFLSADDTRRIGEAAQLLSNLPIFDSSNSTQQISTNVGDTNIEIHITVENISDDYDVDQAVERVQQKILEVAKPVGTSVILRKN